MAKKINRDLVLNGSLTKAFAVLALQIVANSFIQTMYNLTDTFWLGKLGGGKSGSHHADYACTEYYN